MERDCGDVIIPTWSWGGGGGGTERERYTQTDMEKKG